MLLHTVDRQGTEFCTFHGNWLCFMSINLCILVFPLLSALSLPSSLQPWYEASSSFAGQSGNKCVADASVSYEGLGHLSNLLSLCLTPLFHLPLLSSYPLRSSVLFLRLPCFWLFLPSSLPLTPCLIISPPLFTLYPLVSFSFPQFPLSLSPLATLSSSSPLSSLLLCRDN